MRKAVLLAVAVLCAMAANAQNENVLTNQSIVDLVNIGLPENIIITKIETSECRFDTSVDALKELSEKGVNSSIIVAMMNVSHQSAKETEEKRNSISGIFFVDKDGTHNKLQPTVFSGQRANTLGAAFSYGIASVRVINTINGEQASTVVDSDRPEFYFLFNQKSDVFSVTDWWFAASNSPSQFVLAKLSVNEKKNMRELQMGKVNMYAGISNGIDEKARIDFEFVQESDGRFRITPSKPLEAGEYCFFFQGTLPKDGLNNNSVFDFSVPESVAPVIEQPATKKSSKKKK